MGELFMTIWGGLYECSKEDQLTIEVLFGRVV